LNSPKTGVPVLLVNLITLFFTVLMVAWMATSLFGLRLAPLLATSAALSIVLGLALQDTLGNLMAGVSLQIDKPYELDDWIEVQSGAQKWIGRVHEITWRATVLVSFADDILTIPNRVMAQSEIVNYSAHLIPFSRTLTLRVPYHRNFEELKSKLLEAVRQVPAIEVSPAPVVTIGELNESGIVTRITYSISDFGKHTVIATKVYEKILEKINDNDIEIAPKRVGILSLDNSKS
jgi:small-conductance mechanosensitive channel